MKVPAVIALLFAVTSISSTASAQPREEGGGRVPYGHKAPPKPPPPPPKHGDWIKLATPTPTRFGTEWIVLGKNAGAFRALRIDQTSGTVHLRSVRVEFASGKITTFPLDKVLTSRRPNARIDFGQAHRIDRIAVTTARKPAGTYAVYGSWSVTSSGELVAILSE